MSRATNSFENIRAIAEDSDASQKTDRLRASIASHIEVLADALKDSVTTAEVEKAIFELQADYPPTEVLNVVELALCNLVKLVALAGNATLRTEMETITPSAIGELPELLIETTRMCLDDVMLATEKRTSDALVYLQTALQHQCQADQVEHSEYIRTLKERIADLEGAVRATEAGASSMQESLTARAVEAAHKTMLDNMAVITEKTFTIQMCRDTIAKLEAAKRHVSAANKAARRAVVDHPDRDLPDIEEEQKMQQNIDAEVKDMATAERERYVHASQCLNVPMVMKASTRMNVDALKALSKMIGSKTSAHWDAAKATEVKTLQSRFITDNIQMLYALAPMSARLRDHGTGATWRVPTVHEVAHQQGGESKDEYFQRLEAIGFAPARPEQYLIDEYTATRGLTPEQAEVVLRQEQVMAIQKEYINANELAFNHLKEQMPSVVQQIVLSRGQIMGDSAVEVVNQAAEHDYLSVLEQIIMASATFSVLQEDDVMDALRSSAGLFMMDDWREGVRKMRQRIQKCDNLNLPTTHASTVYKFMLAMRRGNPAAFTHLQLEYAHIPVGDKKTNYLPKLVTFVGAYEHFMSITRAMDRRLGSDKKQRAACVKRALAYDSDDSDDGEVVARAYDSRPRTGPPLSFRTKQDQQKAAVRDSNGRRLCDVKGCGAALTQAELAVIDKVQTKSDHRYKGSRFYKDEQPFGPFKQARCNACCTKAHESGVPSTMRDGYKLKGFPVDKARVTRDQSRESTEDEETIRDLSEDE